MTGIIWNITPTTTTVATDSRWWESVDQLPNGLVSKLYPLPAFNAVMAGGTWAGMVRNVIGYLTAKGFSDADDLRGQLPGILRDAWSDFLIDAEDRGMDPDLCVFWLLEPGRGWLIGNDNGFDPIALPNGLWCDPEVNPNGKCAVGETFRGDGHLVDIMRRQRAAREKPTGNPIGGWICRATITSDGIALARIGDLEDDAQPAKPARKVGRNEPCPCGSGQKAKRCCQA